MTQNEVPMFSVCPRCNCRGYDKLKTHSYCVECDYCPDVDVISNFVPPPKKEKQGIEKNQEDVPDSKEEGEELAA